MRSIYAARPISIIDVCIALFAVEYYSEWKKEDDDCNSENDRDESKEGTGAQTCITLK